LQKYGIKSPYAIVTPAYNEARFIAATIESVLAQTVRPLLWMIVDDGSTDDTAGVVQRYAKEHPWIQYVRRAKQPGQSYYASNVCAIEAGLPHIGKLDYDYLAILDADISLPPDYYETVLTRMAGDNQLGIASGVYVDRVGQGLRKVLNDRRSTPKALMVFRRACYDAIGGFVPLKYGGEDTCACFAARMKGWKTWSFPNLVAVHNKPVGTGHAGNLVTIRFRQGWGEYFLASHPLFMLAKCLRRCLKEPPFVVGGLARLTGYVGAWLNRQQRQMPADLVSFIQKEQLARVFKGNHIPDAFRPVETTPASVATVAAEPVGPGRGD